MSAGVDPFDRGAGAVEETEPVVVAQREDGVAFGERSTAEHDLVVTEVALVPEGVAGATVEVVDVGEAGGDHQHVVAVDAGGHPRVDELLADVVVGGGVVDAVVTEVVVEGAVGVAGSELGERGALPRVG